MIGSERPNQAYVACFKYALSVTPDSGATPEYFVQQERCRLRSPVAPTKTAVTNLLTDLKNSDALAEARPLLQRRPLHAGPIEAIPYKRYDISGPDFRDR